MGDFPRTTIGNGEASSIEELLALEVKFLRIFGLAEPFSIKNSP